MKLVEPPRFSSPWRVLLPVGLGTGLSLIGDSSLYTVLPTHSLDAGVMLATVGILLSANRFVRLLSNSSVGWICDRWPRRPVFVPALFMGALSTAIYAMTQGFWPLLAGRLLWGISWSGIWVAGNAIIFDIVDDQSRGRWVGLYHISFFTGAASGSILGGSLTDWLGYHNAMWVAASLTLSGALVALFFLPETRVAAATSYERGTTTVRDQTAPPSRVNLAEFASATALMGVNRIVIAGILMSTFGIYLRELLGEAVTFGPRTVGVATLTGLGLGLSSLSSMLFTPVVGGLSDRARNRWQVVTGGLISGVFGFGLLASGLPVTALLGLPFTFLASSSNQGLATALMGDLSVGARHGRFLGVLFTVGDLGSAVGPPLAYWLIPYWSARGVYWLSAGLFLCMLLVAARWAFGKSIKKRPYGSELR